MQNWVNAKAPARVVKVAVLGTGKFGAGIVAQSPHVPQLEVCAVADLDLEAARKSFPFVSPKDVRVCTSQKEARAALESGKRVVTTDASILLDQPIDVVVETTGNPESGARHAKLAIEHGKHVAMVTKETDAAVGPILKHMADRAGVVYTAVDGDQHGLLIGLVRWARMLGLEIECAGKALDGELIFDVSSQSLYHKKQTLQLKGHSAAMFAPQPGMALSTAARMRSAALGEHAGAKPWDVVELAIAANATGFGVDVPETHCPPAWTTEVPAVLCSQANGGILSRTGVIDAVQVLRQSHEAGMGGGVFVVIRAGDESMRHILQSKGAICHPDGATAMIMHPHHLLGIEAIGSILSAALHQSPTGAWEYQPKWDVVYQALKNLPAGTNVGHDHSPEITALIHPAQAVSPGTRLPSGLAQRARLVKDIIAGEVITMDMVEEPKGSVLWALRREQDRHFKLS